MVHEMIGNNSEAIVRSTQFPTLNVRDLLYLLLKTYKDSIVFARVEEAFVMKWDGRQ